MSTFFRVLIGLIVIAHGLVHPILSVIPDDNLEDKPLGSFWMKSWLLGEKPFAKTVQYILSGTAALALLLAGLSFIGFLVPQAWWQALWLVGAGVSAFLLIVFWHPQFFVGLIIDAVMVGLITFTSFSPD